MKFDELDISSKLNRKILDLGFYVLTPIQDKCIPEIIKGRDIVGQSKTGSGKTFAFAIPIIDKVQNGKGIQAVILTPTRELCVQITQVFRELGSIFDLKVASVFGGVRIEPQINSLQNSEIVVGTPGRMLDHIGRNTIDFRSMRFLVIDEIDKLFEMGFIEDVEEIISYVPRDRQTLMFSATMQNDLLRIMSKHLKNPLIVSVDSYLETSKLKQLYYDIYNKKNKFSLLVHLIRKNYKGMSIVFCSTRNQVDLVARNLKNQGLRACAIHGGMTQKKRLSSLDLLQKQNTDILVATDVAARGLDIKNVTHIYNYDVPKTSQEYIHRVGRTARAGENGNAITLLTKPDHDNFRNVQSNDNLEIHRANMPNFKSLPFIIRRPYSKNKNFR
ncbi:MAG: DEAD/DEAH box helicase [Candidatus Thermoplasmatota archaeon]|nr:DEAD/DEAH box helicase [Candidatus Thermoplasmatota archaeon]